MAEVHQAEYTGRGPEFGDSMYNSDLYPGHVLPDSRCDSDFDESDMATEAEARQQDRLASALEGQRRQAGGQHYVDDEGEEGETDEDQTGGESCDSDDSMETD
jgi:hypothetical protein